MLWAMFLGRLETFTRSRGWSRGKVLLRKEMGAVKKGGGAEAREKAIAAESRGRPAWFGLL
jgi:hypothetical protein